MVAQESQSNFFFKVLSKKQSNNKKLGNLLITFNKYLTINDDL